MENADTVSSTLQRKALPAFKNIAIQCLQKPSDNPATFDFLHYLNYLLMEGAALIK